MRAVNSRPDQSIMVDKKEVLSPFPVLFRVKEWKVTWSRNSVVYSTGRLITSFT
jgi:hypothetical protein